MRLSVIVCTYNRAETIVGCLDSIAVSLANAPPIAAEIVIVDNASTDDTAIVTRTWAEKAVVPVRLVTERMRGLSNARNCGIRNSQGTLLVFTDDDCRLHSDYVTQLLRCDDNDVEPVLRGGRVELGDPADLPITIVTRPNPEKWSRKINSARHMNLGDTLLGCNLAMRKEVANIIGPFDVRLGSGSRIPGGDDTDYVFRAYLAGIVIEYVPTMLVYHYHGRRSPTEGKNLFQNYSMGGGAIFAKFAFKAPALCRPLCWDIKNAVREIKCGTNLFMPSLNFSYMDKLRWYSVGAVRFVIAATIGLVRKTVSHNG